VVRSHRGKPYGQVELARRACPGLEREVGVRDGGSWGRGVGGILLWEQDVGQKGWCRKSVWRSRSHGSR